MNYSELTIAFTLQKDINLIEINDFIANYIYKIMLQDNELSVIHKSKDIKPYVVCYPFPIEKDKVYHAGRLYAINIRSFNMEFLLKLRKHARSTQYPLKVFTLEINNYNYKYINKLVCLTPIVATLDSKKYWTKEHGLSMLQDKLHNNIVKKHRHIFGNLDEPKVNFISAIELNNKKPIKIVYDSYFFLGNKLTLFINDDQASQTLAFTGMGLGVGEKSSVLCGYCMAR